MAALVVIDGRGTMAHDHMRIVAGAGAYISLCNATVMTTLPVTKRAR